MNALLTNITQNSTNENILKQEAKKVGHLIFHLLSILARINYQLTRWFLLWGFGIERLSGTDRLELAVTC